MPESEKFYSKVLLFGEYALMVGSQALSVPYDAMFGRFSFGQTSAGQLPDSNAHLKRYAGFLRKQAALKQALDLSLFEKEIASGLVFESNIPLGYGLGSSGALVAAVYRRYAFEKVPPSNLSALKQILAAMESWFHGKSSGLDPLICYLHRPVLVEGDEQLKTVTIPSPKPKPQGVLFLLDTETTGETRPLVNYFMQQYRKPGFLKKIKEDLIPLNSRCIRAYLAGDAETLAVCMKQLSAFTLAYFRPMIPDKLLYLWEKGLEDHRHFLKLCGSGGGGMMLGFTREIEILQEIPHSFPVKILQQL